MNKKRIIIVAAKILTEPKSLLLKGLDGKSNPKVSVVQKSIIKNIVHWGFIVAQQMLQFYPDYSIEIWGRDESVKLPYSFNYKNIVFRLFPVDSRKDLLLDQLILEDPCIVHVHDSEWDCAYICSMFKASSTRHKVVLSWHSSITNNFDYEELGLNYTDAFLHCSFDNLNIVKPLCRGITEQISVGVDFNKFIPSDKQKSRRRLGLDANDFIFLSVGRLDQSKRVHFTINALKEYSNYDWKFIIVGGGQSRSELEELASDLIKMERVIFTGIISRDDKKIVDYYNSADIFIHSSRKEGAPCVTIEAMACKIPIVSTNMGSAASFLKIYGYGCLFPVDQTEAGLHNELGKILQKHNLPQLADREIARSVFSTKVICSKLNKIYENL